MTDRGKRCRYHCAVCDAHFTSLAGFDAHHRVVTETNYKGAKTRYTVCRSEPRNTELTEYVQVPGTCDLTKGKIGQGVECSIWKNAREDTRFKQDDSKPPNNAGKVIRRLSAKDALETIGDDSTAMLAALNECRVCGKTIQPTGRRGRPRKIHEECR